MSELREEYRHRFIAELTQRGFAEADPTRDGGAGYVGEVGTPYGPQRIRLSLPRAFPYRAPSVFALGETSRRRHEDPESGGLCLWPSQGAGWDPNFTTDELFDRIRQWFIHDAEGSWPVEDRPPDLHLSVGRIRDRLMVTGDEWPPPDGEWGRFAVWDDGVVLTLATNARAGNDSVPLGAGDPMVQRYGADTERAKGTIGLWFRLPDEPSAPRRVADLLATLESYGQDSEELRVLIRGLLGAKVRTPTRLFFALAYPDPDRSQAQEERWLFLDADISPGSTWDQIRQTRLSGYETAPGDAAALRRRLGQAEVDLRGRSVVIFGLGALGSPLALLLAKSGVGRLRLYDGDRLRPGNVIRHSATLRTVGFRKAHALGMVIRGYCPDATVETEFTCWDPALIDEGIEGADVVVDTTATPSFGLLLADRCNAARKPLVSLVAHQNGRLGRIQVFRPSEDPCPQCYRNSNDPGVVPDLAPDDVFVETGCGDPTSYASPVDLEATSNAAAHAVLGLLRGNQRANQIFIVNSVSPNAVPPLDREGIWFQVNERESNCGLCG